MTNTTTIVLVGACNGDPMYQQFFGTLFIDFKTNKPVLQYWSHNCREINDIEIYDNRVTFKTWCGGHGVSFRKDGDGWKFTTGLRPYESGSSGILINGGPEMERFLNNIE